MTELEQAKLELKARKLANKIKKMSPEDYNQFMKKLINKTMLYEAKIKLNGAKIKAIQSKPKARKFNDGKLLAVVLSSEVVCAAMGALIAYGATNSMADAYYAGFIGTIVGMGAATINGISNTHKPLANLLNEARINGLNKKIKKMKSENYINEYIRNMASLDMIR